MRAVSDLVAVTVCETGETREVARATVAIVVGMDGDDDDGRATRVPFVDSPAEVWSVDDDRVSVVEDALADAHRAWTTFVHTVGEWRDEADDRVAYVQFCLNDRDDPMSRWRACRLKGETK